MDFAKWRYETRGLRVEAIPVSKVDEVPALEKSSYDMVIVAEVFEHVPDPLQCLEALTHSLRSGGMLFDSMGGDFDRKLGGDHLKEALDIGNSEEYQSFHRNNYVQLNHSRRTNYLFQYTG